MFLWQLSRHVRSQEVSKALGLPLGSVAWGGSQLLRPLENFKGNWPILGWMDGTADDAELAARINFLKLNWR